MADADLFQDDDWDGSQNNSNEIDGLASNSSWALAGSGDWDFYDSDDNVRFKNDVNGVELNWGDGKIDANGLRFSLGGTYGSENALEWDDLSTNAIYALEGSQKASDANLFIDAGSEIRLRTEAGQHLRLVTSSESNSGKSAVEVKHLLDLRSVNMRIANTQKIKLEDSGSNYNNSIRADSADNMVFEVAGSDIVTLLSGGPVNINNDLNVDNIGGNQSVGITFDENTTHDFATENLQMLDAGSTNATEQDWVEVKVGGTFGYIRVHSSK